MGQPRTSSFRLLLPALLPLVLAGAVASCDASGSDARGDEAAAGAAGRGRGTGGAAGQGGRGGASVTGDGRGASVTADGRGGMPAATGPLADSVSATAPAGPATAPAVAAVVRRIAVIGDYGGDSEEEAAVAAMILGWNPDAVITAGDNNYSEGTAAALDRNVGKHYHPFIGAYRGSFGSGSATNRFFPAFGDHDWESGVEAYLEYFTLPGNERYYDVDLGPVRLYAINSNAEEPDGYEPSSAQGQWLQQKLASSTACFDLVYFHHPPRSSGMHGSRPHMEWPFAAWGAEATFAGHDHDYERLDVSGIPYFVIGSSGLGLRPFPGGPLPETRFRDDQHHGAILVTASSDGTITYEFWSPIAGRLDSFTAKKSC